MRLRLGPVNTLCHAAEAGFNEDPNLNLFGQLKRVAREWLDTCLVCKGGTYPAQLLYRELADLACARILIG